MELALSRMEANDLWSNTSAGLLRTGKVFFFSFVSLKKALKCLKKA